MKMLIAAGSVLAMLAGCATPAMVDRGIEDSHKRFESAWNMHDAKELAQVYTADAKLMPPNAPLIVGRDNIEAFWKARFDAGVNHIETKSIMLEMSGDKATDFRSFIAKVKDATVSGKSNYLWSRNADGSWSIAADIWNYDAGR